MIELLQDVKINYIMVSIRRYRWKWAYEEEINKTKNKYEKKSGA